MKELLDLNKGIIGCRACPRLVRYREKVAEEKVKRFADEEYWGRPLTGFGDENAEVLIIGLAPAAHGGNRTGRMFTGDSSGNWLIRALYENGFANQVDSISKGDGLELRRVYITATVRCVPPSNSPIRSEIENCSAYLTREIELMKRVRIILVLGKIAFDSYLRHHYHGKKRGLRFRHGELYDLGREYPLLIASYHPSRQNTQTGRLSREMWESVFETIVFHLNRPRQM